MRPAEQWCEDEMTASVKDNRTLIVGLGATGVSAARFLATRGDEFLVVDSRARPPGLEDLRRSSPRAEVILESLDPRWLEGVSQVVLSPGLGVDIAIAVEARRRGIPVVSDIELFARVARAPIVGVTGSNGKSTVVTLVERMLSAGGVRVAAGGNLGPPALDLLDEDAEAYVLELSSFQLEITESLRPVAAAVLNLSPDHLDRHGSFERYAAIKAGLLGAAEVAVCNWDDPTVREMAREHTHAIPFSIREFLDRGYSVVEHRGERWLSRDGEPLLPAAALRMQGLHNQANALAALGLASVVADRLERRDLGRQLDALREFSGLPHRCQWVAEHWR